MTTVGRGETNDISTNDPSASRRHLEIRAEGAGYTVEDLDSKNGTYLNGERLERPETLAHGDVISLPGLRLVFRVSQETMTAPTVVKTRVRIDLNTAEVWVEDRAVSLTAKEFLALRVLVEAHGALVTKDELARAAWPEFQGAVADGNIETLVSRLRRKIDPDPEQSHTLLTVRGLGYRLLSS